MPLPRTLTLANYRAFPGPTELELRPLTLLYGWNSAGKSALLRLLPLVADAARPGAAAALDLSGEVGKGNSFQDVKWKGRIEESDPEQMRLSIGFGWPPPAKLERLVLRFDQVDDPERIVIKSFEASPRGAPSVTAALASPTAEPGTGALPYDVAVDVEDAPPSDFRLVFRMLRQVGLVVDAADSGAGLVQVMPVLAAAELARRHAAAGRPRILAVEEPESNLHPNAQRWLAEHLAICSDRSRALPPPEVGGRFATGGDRRCR